MKIVKVSEVSIKDTSHKIDARELYNKDSTQAIRIKLQPGENLKPHKTPVNVFFYVLEGTPEIMVDMKTQIVEADCIVESPKDILHNISNNSDKIARILVVKTPKPTTETKLL